MENTLIYLDPRLLPSAKIGLAWDTGLMTTGQVTLYSVCISYTENYSFGGSHEHPFSAGRQEITIVFLFSGGVRHLHGDDADPELRSIL